MGRGREGGVGWRGLPDAGEPSIQQRDTEIGRVVWDARRRKGYGRLRCAELLGVSPERYGRMETGKSGISVGQLERLVRYLDIPVSAVFPQALAGAVGEPLPVLVTAHPGQSVQIVVNVVDAPARRGG